VFTLQVDSFIDRPALLTIALLVELLPLQVNEDCEEQRSDESYDKTHCKCEEVDLVRGILRFHSMLCQELKFNEACDGCFKVNLNDESEWCVPEDLPAYRFVPSSYSFRTPTAGAQCNEQDQEAHEQESHDERGAQVSYRAIRLVAYLLESLIGGKFFAIKVVFFVLTQLPSRVILLLVLLIEVREVKHCFDESVNVEYFQVEHVSQLGVKLHGVGRHVNLHQD